MLRTFGTHIPLAQNKVTQVPLFICLTSLRLCNTHPQPTPSWGLAAPSLTEPSSVFAYAVPITLLISIGFFSKIPNFCSSFFMLCHNPFRQHAATVRNMNLVCRILYFKFQIRKILLPALDTSKKKKNKHNKAELLYRQKYCISPHKE